MFLYVDIETFSEVPLSGGTYRYAEAAEVMLFAWAIDDGPVSVLECDRNEKHPAELVEAWRDPCVTIVAHNVGFDRTVLRARWPNVPPLERWHCTMAQARAHGLPGSLATLGAIFGVAEDQQKQKDGKALVQLFCKPRPKNSKLRRATRETHPEQWAQFVDYAAHDILAMRALHRKMPTWNYTGFERELWQLDQTINARGFAVDLDLADAAVETIARVEKSLSGRVGAITSGDVDSANQRDALLAYILDAYGVELPNMQAPTLERRLEDPELPEAVKELIAIRLEASTTSVKKYRRVREGVNSDGRLRGTLEFCGAGRTGRWSGRVFQPQNLARPTLKNAEIEAGIEAVKAGIADLIYA